MSNKIYNNAYKNTFKTSTVIDNCTSYKLIIRVCLTKLLHSPFLCCHLLNSVVLCELCHELSPVLLLLLLLCLHSLCLDLLVVTVGLLERQPLPNLSLKGRLGYIENE